MNLYHDCIKIAVYKVAEGETGFRALPESEKAYLGCVHIMWKKSYHSVRDDGESPVLTFSEELRATEEPICKYNISGSLSGEIKWIAFGHANSRLNADGTKKKAAADGAEAQAQQDPGSFGTL